MSYVRVQMKKIAPLARIPARIHIYILCKISALLCNTSIFAIYCGLLLHMRNFMRARKLNIVYYRAPRQCDELLLSVFCFFI